MILLHCEARKLRNGNINPKNYPYWKELINELKEFDFIQIGITGDTQYCDHFIKDKSLSEIRKLIQQCDSWIAIDSFFQHLAWEQGKKGICIFGYSDPYIFGHSENINLVDRNKLRADQFGIWEDIKYDKTIFLDPLLLADIFRKFIKYPLTNK